MELYINNNAFLNIKNGKKKIEGRIISKNGFIEKIINNYFLKNKNDILIKNYNEKKFKSFYFKNYNI